ncbi:hypothetical protein ACHAQI_006403 [Fusarium lateritium]
MTRKDTNIQPGKAGKAMKMRNVSSGTNPKKEDTGKPGHAKAMVAWHTAKAEYEEGEALKAKAKAENHEREVARHIEGAAKWDIEAEKVEKEKGASIAERINAQRVRQYIQCRPGITI